MPRSTLAYLEDVVRACDAIEGFLVGIDFDAYRATLVTRSAVERQLLVAGEAIGVFLRTDPRLSERISHARRIVDFRNLLAHDYAMVNDAVVWSIATDEAPLLRSECAAVLAELDAEVEAD